MSKIFKEENGFYCIDCTKAVWATDKLNSIYHEAKIQLKDVDFIIESEEFLILVEYKNANVSGAEHPEAFNPKDDKYFNTVIQKYYDSLPYLILLNNPKPRHYIYVVEWVKSDSVARKRLRERLKNALPFRLQENLSDTIRIIDDVNVLSIKEWNEHPIYKNYPIYQIGERSM